MADTDENERGSAGTDDDGGDRVPDVPEATVDEAERLTRLARRAVDGSEEEAYRAERDDLLADHGYRARVRTDGDGDVLVCYPEEWVEEGVVVPERVENVERGVERPLEGPGEPDEWATVAEDNDELVAAVEAEHGPTHAANARALADFAGNHYAKRVGALTGEELREFREEYYPRNVWPDDDQQAVLDGSLRRCYETAGVDYPLDHS